MLFRLQCQLTGFRRGVGFLRCRFRCGRNGFGGRDRRRIRIHQPHERGTDQPALERKTGRESFSDDRIRGGILDAVGAESLSVKLFIGRGTKRGDTNPAGGVAAGILKIADLVGEVRLPGTGGGIVECENVVQDAGDHLQPFAFTAAEFFHLEPERTFFGVIELHLKFVKFADFLGHALGDLPGGGNGFIRVAFGGFLHARPLVGGGGDLGGIFFQIVQLFRHRGDGIDLDQFFHGAIFQDERQAAQQGPQGDQAGGDELVCMGNGVRRPVNDSKASSQQNQVGGDKRPLGDFPFRDVFHAVSVRKMSAQCKSPASFFSTIGARNENHGRVRTCIIFNPVARGDKARHFRDWLDGVAGECVLKPTQRAGDARRLAAEAVAESFELVVAAGGDGTVNEVLNGLADAPDGFAKAHLGVLPLGTVNVFARELNIPTNIPAAWKMLRSGKAITMDVPLAEFSHEGKRECRHFIQMAGAGLDARAIELTNWQLKKKFGPLAYVIAGLHALMGHKPKISAKLDGQALTGELILIGNGKFYGGKFVVFPAADWTDGRLEICAWPRTNFWTLLRCAPGLLWRKRLPEKMVQRRSAARFELTSETPAAFELDGEWAGHLPATFSISPQKLRVVVP